MSKLSQRIKTARCPFVSAVIVAGGSGARFGSDKLMAPLGGIPVLARTILVFEQSPMIKEIIVVARKDAVGDVVELCRRYRFTKVMNVVEGGQTRMLSSWAGVLATSSGANVVAIHDAARPLVTNEIIEDTVWNAHRHLCAVPAVPVKDTIKQATNRIVWNTPDRAELFAVQTPQCFQRDIITAALQKAVEEEADVTDDCAAVERLGGQIWLTDGSEENLKITTPLDLTIAETILERRNGTCV